MRSGGPDREYNAAAPSEYNEGLWAREYGATCERSAEQNGERKRRRAASARQRALMQATAAVMTAVLVVGAAGSASVRLSPAAPTADGAAAEIAEPDSSNILDDLPGEPEDGAIALTAEQKAFLDELYAACLAEDDAKLHALAHTAMFEALSALGNYHYDGTKATRPQMTPGIPVLQSEYSGDIGGGRVYRRVSFFFDGLRANEGGRILMYESAQNDEADSIWFTVSTADEIDAQLQITASHGYVRRGTLTPGGGYDALSRSEWYCELTGDFVLAIENARVPDMTVLFLENGTVLTNRLTYDLGLPPQQFEVRNGYLDPGSLLTLDRWDDGTVSLTFTVVLPDGSSTGRGIGANWPDDPFYHTPLQS